MAVSEFCEKWSKPCAQFTMRAGRCRILVEDTSCNFCLPNRSPPMDRINRWKLADELTVFQISLLIAGYDPSEFDGEDHSNWASEVKINTAAFIAAIKHAAKNEKITFYANYMDAYNGQELDWNTSTIGIQSLRQWLYDRNYEDGFFISKGDDKEKICRLC